MYDPFDRSEKGLEAYKAARSEGLREMVKDRIKGVDPFPPTLEDMVKDYDVYIQKGFFHKGSVIPSRVVGTHDSGRNTCFSRSFKPLPKVSRGDFATKWANVYSNVPAWIDSGNRIHAYEFMHDLYVAEGNKRISVAKYKKIPLVPSNVERIIPRLSNNSPEVDDYHCYLEFEKKTGIKWLWFTEQSDFERMDELIHSLYGNSRHKYSRFMKEVFNPFLYTYVFLSDNDPKFPIGDMFLEYVESSDDIFSLKANDARKSIKRLIHKKRRSSHKTQKG